MRDSTKLRLLQESNKTLGWLAFFFMLSMIGTISFVNVLMNEGEPRTAVISISLLCGGFFVACLLAMKYARLNALMQDGSDPPRRAVRFENELELPPARLERLVKDNQLLRSTFEFNTKDWLALTHALRDNDWRWIRDVLDGTKLFPKITQTVEFNRVNREFSRMGVIEGGTGQWRVPEEGRRLLYDAAGRNVVP